MPEFLDKAKKFASEHADAADKVLDKAAQFADEKTGGRFGHQIQAGEQQAENYLGVQDQDTQDQGQDDNQQNQGF